MQSLLNRKNILLELFEVILYRTIRNLQSLDKNYMYFLYLTCLLTKTHPGA